MPKSMSTSPKGEVTEPASMFEYKMCRGIPLPWERSESSYTIPGEGFYFGPTISSGRTHLSNCSEVSSFSDMAAAFSVVPS